jgi:hypothetical protein
MAIEGKRPTVVIQSREHERGTVVETPASEGPRAGDGTRLGHQRIASLALEPALCRQCQQVMLEIAWLGITQSPQADHPARLHVIAATGKRTGLLSSPRYRRCNGRAEQPKSIDQSKCPRLPSIRQISHQDTLVLRKTGPHPSSNHPLHLSKDLGNKPAA